jgi:biopolymer transport protein ExbB/TolQ
VLLTLPGGDFLAEFTIGGLAFGGVNVMIYFLISVIATFMLLGSTVYYVFKGLPADPDMLQRLAKVEASLAMNVSMLENTQMGFFRRLEENEKVADEAFRKARIDLEEVRKETNGALEEQRKTLRDIQKESNYSGAIVKKQGEDIVTVKRRVQKIVKALAPTKETARLASNSKLDGVLANRSLALELKNLGVETVGQFLTMDPMVIAEKTMEPPETVTNLQAKSQLLMVPGLNPNDAELLVKVGVTSRKELANQDPVQLCRTIVGIANVYVEQGKMTASNVPTIDDVWSWIKLAQP